MHNSLSVFAFAVTTQREAIIFYCRGFNSPHNNATTVFFLWNTITFFFFIVILVVGLLNDTENLVFVC